MGLGQSKKSRRIGWEGSVEVKVIVGLWGYKEWRGVEVWGLKGAEARGIRQRR